MGPQDESSPEPEGADPSRRCHFVNHLRVTLSLSEIRFDLALLGPLTSPQPVWSFSTTPDHMVTMHQGFAVAIDSYRRRYGEIRAVQVDPAMVRFADGFADG